MTWVEHRFGHIPQNARRGRAWSASLAPLFEARIADGAVVPLDAFHRHHHLGDAVLTVLDAPAQTTDRTVEFVARQALDHLAFRTHCTGRTCLEAGGSVEEVAPGDVTVLDLGQPTRTAADAGREFVLFVPRHRVLEPGDDGDGLHGRVLRAHAVPLAGLVAAHLRHLAECLASASQPELQDLNSVTLTLSRTLLRSTRGGDIHPRQYPETAPDVAVRRFVVDNLVNVDAPMLMARFGLSRARLYRMFGGSGGVYAHIRDARLAAAMRRLRRHEAPRPKVVVLAHDCGFADARTFSRAFKRRFGVNPDAVRPGTPPEPVAGTQPPPMAWLRDL